MLLSSVNIGELILHYKYLILFPAVMIEGPVSIMLAGLAVSLGFMSLLPVFILVISGDMVGDFIRYGLGRWGGQALIIRWGKYFGFDERHIVGVENAFKKRTGLLLIVAKFAYGTGTIFLAAAGMVKVPILKLLGYDFVGSVLKSSVLIFVGYYFGQAIYKVNSSLEIVASVLLFAVLVAIFVWAYRYGKKSETNGI